MNIAPLFFDHFGFIIWFFLLYISITDLKNKKLIKWPKIILLAIGIIGILIDGTLLLGFYLNWNTNNLAWTFDYLGIPVFLFLIWISTNDLHNSKIKRPKFTKIILLLIAFAGLIADGFSLINHYM